MQMDSRNFRTGVQPHLCNSNNRSAALCLILIAFWALCPILPAQRQFPVLPNQQPGAKVDKVVLLKMRVEDGKVTADVSDCPLQTVLKELADRTGIIFELRSQESPVYAKCQVQNPPPVPVIFSNPAWNH